VNQITTMPTWPRLNAHRQRHVQRLRRLGICVLAACIGLAMLVYRFGVVYHKPTIVELLPDSARVIERQRGILFGRAGVTMMNWLDALERPAGQAFLLVVAGVIGAAACYQVAHAIEVEEG